MASTITTTIMTTTTYTQERLAWVLGEIAELESQMKDTDLSASEQESLLKDWKYMQEQLGEVMENLEEKEEEEDTYDPNNWEDNREGCARCSGCAYCMDSAGYDGSDEI